VKPIVRAGATRGHGSALEHVRRELRPTLRALETAAAAPDALVDAADELPALQYALHVAGERVLGLGPAPGHEEMLDDLAVALAIAREETADVARALEGADEAAAAPLVWEWRAALFGVRLALERVEAPPPEEPAPRVLHAALPVVLVAAGIAAVLAGALAELWPLWTAGLGLVATSTALSRRRP